MQGCIWSACILGNACGRECSDGVGATALVSSACTCTFRVHAAGRVTFPLSVVALWQGPCFPSAPSCRTPGGTWWRRCYWRRWPPRPRRCRSSWYGIIICHDLRLCSCPFTTPYKSLRVAHTVCFGLFIRLVRCLRRPPCMTPHPRALPAQDNKLLRACRATKISSTSLAAFTSPCFPPLGTHCF